MNSTDIRHALSKHWPASQYISIDEAPDSADRTGRKLDRLVCSVYSSRGFEIEGVEIKVSMSDWQRELKDASKADWWFRHVHRFWLAVPLEMAVKVIPTLPTGWGLLACNETCKVAVRPQKHEAEKLPWTTVLGLLRVSTGCGLNALQHQFNLGLEAGRQRAEQHSADYSIEGRLRSELENIQKKVATFEQASGIQIAHGWDLEATGKALAVVKRISGGQEYRFNRSLRNSAEQLCSAAKHIVALADEVEALMNAP